MPNESLDSGLSLLEQDDPGEIKRKLVWRMLIAGLMIAVLLGGLALFDHLATRPDETESVPRFTEPVPVAKKPETPPAESSGPILPAPVPEEEETASTGVPESSATPAAPANQAETVPTPEEESPVPTPVSAPAPGQRAGTPRRATPASSPVAAPAPIRPRASPETAAPPRAAQASETQARPIPAARPVPAGQSRQRQPVLPRLLPGYTFQAGVFADPRRAEDVLTRLAQEGIPATLETRVLVGPFKNQKEAESARAKMKTMGIEALLVSRGEKK